MKHIQFVRVPDWRLEWCGDAGYYGRRWCAHVGPWLVFLWQMTDDEYADWADAHLSTKH